MSFSEKEFRKIMGCFTTGVAIITTQNQGKPIGITINSLTSVSLDPPLVLFCLDKRRAVFPEFLKNTDYAIHILSSTQQDLCLAFSNSSANPWEGLAYEVSRFGCPILPNSLGILYCCRYEIYTCGDHIIFLNSVKNIHWQETNKRKDPLVYFQGKFYYSIALTSSN